MLALDPLPTLSSAQVAFFASNPPPSDASGTPLIPPSLIDHLLKRHLSPAYSDRRDGPLSARSLINLTDQSGIVQVSNNYHDTVQRGDAAFAAFEETLRSIAGGSALSGEEALKRIARAERLLGMVEAAEGMVRDVHTRNGLSEYGVIEAWTNELFARKRALPETGGSMRMEGIMLGFNLSGINKAADGKESTGTAVKLLLREIAHEVAREYGGKGLGLWGTNVIVSGVPAGEGGQTAVEYREKVQSRVLEVLAGARPFPASIAAQMGLERISVRDLPGAAELARHPEKLGLTSGHHAMTVDSRAIQPFQTEALVIKMIAGAGDAEAYAKELTKMLSELDKAREAGNAGRVRELEARTAGLSRACRESGGAVFSGEVPASSPAKGSGLRPLLVSGPALGPGGDPRSVAPVEAGQFSEREVVAQDIRDSRLPRPSHEAGHLRPIIRRLRDGLQELRALIGAGKTAEASRTAAAYAEYLSDPEKRAERGREAKSARGLLQDGYERSLKQHRFPDVYRLEELPEIARRVFNGQKFYMQMAEYENYHSFVKTHRPDKADTLHRLTFDVNIGTYAYHGIEVIVATQGGDEVFLLYGSRTADGKELTQADIERVSSSLTENFEQVFRNLNSPSLVKMPPLPGGIHYAKPVTGPSGETIIPEIHYVIDKDGVVIVEGKRLPRSEREALLRTVHEAHGASNRPRKIRLVDNLSKVASVDRLKRWTKQGPNGLKITVTAQPHEDLRARGYAEERVSPRQTISPAVEIPAGSPAEIIHLAKEKVSEMTSSMKKQGLTHAVGGEAAKELQKVGSALTGSLMRLGFFERLQATPRGRLAVNGGMFVFGGLGADALTGDWENLFKAETYAHMGVSYMGMVPGAYTGEMLMRGAVSLQSPLLRQGGQVTLNRALMEAEFRGAKGLAVRGGGMVGGVVASMLLTEGLHGVKELPYVAASMGAASATSTGLMAGYRVVSGVGKEALSKNPLSLAAVVLIDCTVMKLISDGRLHLESRQRENEIRSTLARRLEAFDQKIRWDFRSSEQTGGDPTVIRSTLTPETLAQDLKEVTEAMGDLIVFQLLHQTSAGEEFLKAQAERAQARQALDRFLKGYPEYAEELSRNPDRETEILSRLKAELESRGSLFYMGAAGGKTPLGQLEDLIGNLNAATDEMRAAEMEFKAELARRFEKLDESQGLSIPMYTITQPRDALKLYQSQLGDNPESLYSQLHGFMTSRMEYLDTLHTYGIPVFSEEAPILRFNPPLNAPRDQTAAPLVLRTSGN